MKRDSKPRTFEDVFASASASARETGTRLRKLLKAALPDLEEKVYGGAKVALALYMVPGSSSVVCGIQPSGTDCLLYVHRVRAGEVDGIALAGAGKHALHARFASAREVPGEALKRLCELARSRV